MEDGDFACDAEAVDDILGSLPVLADGDGVLADGAVAEYAAGADDEFAAPLPQLCGGDTDMPLLEDALPAHIKVRFRGLGCNFRFGCAVDLKAVSLRLRVSTFNPREKTNMLRIRLTEPVTISANVKGDGSVSILRARADDLQLKAVARKITRMIQLAGYPEAKCLDFKAHRLVASAELCHPVRLEAVAKKWGRHVMYDPDVTPGLYFYLAKPRATLKVSSNGKVTLMGIATFEDAQLAVARTHKLFKEFST